VGRPYIVRARPGIRGFVARGCRAELLCRALVCDSSQEGRDIAWHHPVTPALSRGPSGGKREARGSSRRACGTMDLAQGRGDV